MIRYGMSLNEQSSQILVSNHRFLKLASWIYCLRYSEKIPAAGNPPLKQLSILYWLIPSPVNRVREFSNRE